MRFPWIIILLVFILSGCQTSIPSDLAIEPGQGLPTTGSITLSEIAGTPTLSYVLPKIENYYPLPTPDAPHSVSYSPRAEEQYIVKSGDMLSAIAEKYSTTVDAIVETNSLLDPDSIEVGQVLIIPGVVYQSVGPDTKLLPDSELVFIEICFP